MANRGSTRGSDTPVTTVASSLPDQEGLPPALARGIETLSGIAMDDVRVHRNSQESAALSASAYAHGRDIHLDPGQERHLPHEAWHVVQQTKGRVSPTRRPSDGMRVSSDTALEREGDALGNAALSDVSLGVLHAPGSAE